MIVLPMTAPLTEFRRAGGGKAYHLASMHQAGFPVPEFFCVGVDTYETFVMSHDLVGRALWRDDPKAMEAHVEKLFLSHKLPDEVTKAIWAEMQRLGLDQHFVAVRSSGLDEDGAEHSFAGQFSSYLYVKGRDAIEEAIKRCWASAYTERGLVYRKRNGLKMEGLSVGVVIQKMVSAKSAGVTFTRNPMAPLDRDNVQISSVWGLGEGLVNGDLDADHFSVHRETFKVEPHVAKKTEAYRQADAGGTVKLPVSANEQTEPSLSDADLKALTQLSLKIEAHCGGPQDIEWAVADKIYLLQTRPITSLPPEGFYSKTVNGHSAILWDNSNIIESYSGVTSPLTFSFASRAYYHVYVQFCRVMGVPEEIIESHDAMYRNMLGLVRGRIYYNLVNWYRLIIMLPGSGNNKAFMETMMGVKQQLKPELEELFAFVKNPPQYSLPKKLWLGVLSLYRFYAIDSIVKTFRAYFDGHYEAARKVDLEKMSIPELVNHYVRLDEIFLKKWQAPIINDYLCMLFFGLLKKLVTQWVTKGGEDAQLQNDLLCGEGGLESTEPTKMLMRLAARIDKEDPKFGAWLLVVKPSLAFPEMQRTWTKHFATVTIEEFLDRFGFRCVNELKLEEPDLHDDPSFILNSLAGYIRTKNYDLKAMEERERGIRAKAEQTVRDALGGFKVVLFFWILKHARKAVKNRENLRFARTKVFGICRGIFRAIGRKLHAMRFLEEPADVFYMTVEEIIAFSEGRALTSDMRALTQLRKKEFDRYRDTPPPPDRFMTEGTVGANMHFPAVMDAQDLMRGDMTLISDDPDILLGTSCCPGIIEGPVRVVKAIVDAEGMNGEILVTARTDPGWVPLYPSARGLLIERGSLLSHSAVVARELGLPTIVGVNGGLMDRLKTGDVVRVDAGKGVITILSRAGGGK